MSVNNVLMSALTPIAPTEADVYEGKGNVYVTFNCDTIPDDFGDNGPGHERVLVQVHLYAPTGKNVMPQRKAVKKALYKAGFTWPSYINASDKNGQHHVFECETVQWEGDE